MKLGTTRFFLRDWLACKASISRLGHFGATSRIDGKAMYARHQRTGGEVPEEIYISKKRYGWSRPVCPARTAVRRVLGCMGGDRQHLAEGQGARRPGRCSVKAG